MRIEIGGTPLSRKQFRAWKERKLVKIQDFETYAGITIRGSFPRNFNESKLQINYIFPNPHLQQGIARWSLVDESRIRPGGQTLGLDMRLGPVVRSVHDFYQAKSGTPYPP